MQLTKTLWVSAGSNQRFSACRDRPVARIGPKSNWARTIGIPDLLVVGNLDRHWLVALVWTLETRIEGGSKMMARFARQGGHGKLRTADYYQPKPKAS